MANDPTKCHWKEDDVGGFWETSCGEAHCFETGDPAENKYKFCPYCGKPLNTGDPREAICWPCDMGEHSRCVGTSHFLAGGHCGCEVCHKKKGEQHGDK